MSRNVFAAAAAMLMLIGAGGCSEEGTAERAGRAMDEAADDVREAFDDDGPLENAGEKADEAIEKARKKLAGES